MEFADPIVAAEEISKSEESELEPKSQTQNAIHRLEDDIDSAYSAIESKFSSLWANASQGALDLQEKMKLEERKQSLIDQVSKAKENINNSRLVQENIQSVEKQLKEISEQVKSLETKVPVNTISSQANRALDSLDSKLEIVENQAGKLVSLFTSFFSSIVSIDSPKEESIKELETIFSSPGIPGAAYSSSRYDTDLFKLHTSEHFYLNGNVEDNHDVAIDGKTEEISSLLKQYPDTLEQLMNRLVPVEILYKKFWSRYFVQEQRLRENERSRKELLSKDELNSGADLSKDFEEDDEEDFTWDDDDDDEEEEAAEEGEDDGQEEAAKEKGYDIQPAKDE